MTTITSKMAVIGIMFLMPAGLLVSLEPHDSSKAIEENIGTYDGVNIKAYKNGELVAETHNVLMEGEEAIETQIKSGTSLSWDTIAVGNGSEPTDSSGSLDSEISSCGLAPQTATIQDTGDGSWNLTATFDATCDDIDVNTTAQKSTGADSSIDYFAGAHLGRTINLYSGDSLTIEWSNQVQ